MNMNEYQKQSWDLAVYPDRGSNMIYPTLGLTGEAGETAEQVKKMIRDDNGKLTDERRDKIIKELGDCLWYISALAAELSVSLDVVAQTNLKKLTARRAANTLRGEGSSR